MAKQRTGKGHDKPTTQQRTIEDGGASAIASSKRIRARGRDDSGRTLPANGSTASMPDWEALKPPPILVERNAAPLWYKLRGLAKAGDRDAIYRLLDLVETYSLQRIDPDDESADVRYAKLPAQVADLCRECDMEITRTVGRYLAGDPCSPLEVLIAETALACEGKDTTPVPARTWSESIVAEAERLAELRHGK